MVGPFRRSSPGTGGGDTPGVVGAGGSRITASGAIRHAATGHRANDVRPERTTHFDRVMRHADILLI